MMDKELVQQSQSEQATNGPAPSTPTTPTPPRLIPNPMLLDSPAPTLTPTTSSPPPPLTPAPCVAAHGPKAAAVGGTLSPHVLVPAPPKLTSTATPALRTYSRPILPSPATKASPSMQTSSSSSVVTATTASPLPYSSPAVTQSNTMTSTSLTNGSTRPGPTSTPIIPFHTPASPPGRQVQQAHPVGTPGLMRANQSPSPVRQRVSQQALLLGKGLKGSGQDQVLLRAQMLILTSAMRPAQSPSSSSFSSSSSVPSSNPASAQLQSLTLRPPPPGTLTIPPSLRLKPPSSAPPPLSRPSAPVFPPLRPRPQPSTVAKESPTAPSRHLPVPPPTLYSPVRAVPLRPRLLSPNGHRATTPRQSPALQPIAVAPSSQTTSVSKPLTGLKSCALTHTVLGPTSSQHSPLSSSNHFERSPSAARQLQIIALSSSQQPQAGTYVHPAVKSKPSELPELSSQSKRTVKKEDLNLLPLNPPPLPSAPSHTQTLSKKREPKESEEQGNINRGAKPGIKDERSVSKDLQLEKDVQREKVKQEKLTEMEQEPQSERDKALMEVTAEDERDTERRGTGKKRKMEEEEGGDIPMDTSDSLSGQLLHQHQNTDTVKDSSMESKPSLDLTPVPVKTPLKGTVSAQTPRSPEPQQDLQPSHEDFCENMSTQSDNQSALSSLSSQSPPCSPFIVSASENPHPLLAAQITHPNDLSRTPAAKADMTPSDSQHAPQPKTELIYQSEDESESFSQSLGSPWEMKAWPEGRQVLTHLVEGFVIQEGLQPFPVNRSSLLVPEQVSKPQEVNGTNGKAALPAADPIKQTEASTDSEEEDGRDVGDLENKSGHRDRTVLHCQFCGKRGHAHNFMRSKRFCSTACARGFNVRLTKRLRALSAGSRSERPRPTLNRAESVPGKPLLLRLPRDLWSAGRREKDGKEKPAAAAVEHKDGEEDKDMRASPHVFEEAEEDDDDGGEEDPAVAMAARMERRAARRARRASAPAFTASTPTTTFRPAPSQWSVEEVTAFIQTLPGCGDVAEAFRLQEIDGQALLLLTEDHLMTSMNIKLGPALKICAHINALKNQ
ncbi:hypothetical protein AMECASPLE_000305 [Ameca splendens]|uniref:Polyhomeotic-like protein 3 n=1 Tax=Ameca splendens TaxID=208324 RepID=A0ABV0YKI1_9TELE